jgi:hypothetical protein
MEEAQQQLRSINFGKAEACNQIQVTRSLTSKTEPYSEIKSKRVKSTITKAGNLT